jgi:RimJ/RimL family protein N-acetyltransferase
MQGELIRLRGFEKSDADAMLRWASDEEVVRWHGPPDWPASRAQQDRYIERATAADAEDKAFAIETLDGELVGDCGLRKIDWKSRKAEFFITIGEKQFWDKGFGADTLKLIIRLAFDKMNLNRVWLTVLADNPRAVRCYEKCGFAREGLLRQESFVDGKYRDVLMMAILKEDYERTRGA